MRWLSRVDGILPTTLRAGLPFLAVLWLAGSAAAQVFVIKSHDDPNGNGELRPGQQLRYRINIQNLNQDVNDVRLTDPIPAGMRFLQLVQDGGGTVISTSPVLRIDNIAVAFLQTVTVEFVVEEDSTAGLGSDLCNVATIETSGNPAPRSSPPSCVRLANPAGQLVFINKLHDDPNGNGELFRSQQLTYTLTVLNIAGPTSDIAVSDTIPAGMRFVRVDNDAGGTVVSTTPVLRITGISLGTGQQGTVRFTVEEDGSRPLSTNICNRGTVETANNPGPAASPSACIRVVNPTGNVFVTKSHDNPNGTNQLNRGQALRYFVVVDNLGPAVSDVRVLDTIPAGMRFVSLDADGGGTVISTSPVLQIDNIAVAELGQKRVEFTVEEARTVPENADICNFATIVTSANAGPVSSSLACIKVVGPPSSVQVIKSHNDPNGNGILNVGQELSYRVRIQNDGAALSDVSVTDTLPAGVSFVRVDDLAGGTLVTQTPTLRIDSIPVAAGGAATVIFTVQEAGAGPNVQVCNTANAASASVPFSLDTAPACIRTAGGGPGCVVADLTARTGLLGIKDRAAGPTAATFRWNGDPKALEHHLNSVPAKAQLLPPGPRLDNGATLRCRDTDADCTDPSALVCAAAPCILYYEALSACGQAAADEGPAN